jgi:hypothetical protein
MFGRDFQKGVATLHMNFHDAEDQRTVRLWSIRLTVMCALLILGVLTIAAIGSNFADPPAGASTPDAAAARSLPQSANR